MKRLDLIWWRALAIVLFVVCPSSLFAATIFVDNTLSADITNGTYSIAFRNATGADGNAYRTVRAAVSSMVAGDTCYLRGGTYHEIAIDLQTKNDGSQARPYTLSSYPGEWGIIDGNHAGTASDQSIFTTYGKPISYWRFVRLEITGGGNLTALPNYGAGIHVTANHCLFQYLYVHDNFASTVNAGAAAGLMLLGGSQYNVVEFCHFKGNGNPLGDINTANANLAIYSDYKYANPVDITTATVKNEVRFNLFEGVSAAGRTPIGFSDKGFQRLTGYTHGETRNAADALPNDATYRAYGDKIHNNIFIGHAQAARLDQDYVQFYNNIVDIDLTGAIAAVGFGTATDRFAAVRTADAYITRRGSFWPGVYNNTVLANTGQGVTLTTIKGGWNCSVDGTVSDYSAGFAPNNIIDSADAGYDWKALSINSGSSTNCAGAQPHVLTKFNLSRNLIYKAKDPTNIIYFERLAGEFTAATIGTSGAADLVWSRSDLSPYIGTTGSAKYKASGTYALDGSHTIGSAGLGGKHPYLDVQIPSYVGAVDPGNSGWVDTVLGLSDTQNLKDGTGMGPAKPTAVSVRH